jgi:hypothetical protein
MCVMPSHGVFNPTPYSDAENRAYWSSTPELVAHKDNPYRTNATPVKPGADTSQRFADTKLGQTGGAGGGSSGSLGSVLGSTR